MSAQTDVVSYRMVLYSWPFSAAVTQSIFVCCPLSESSFIEFPHLQILEGINRPFAFLIPLSFFVLLQAGPSSLGRYRTHRRLSAFLFV